jgi:hypothetical protein
MMSRLFLVLSLCVASSWICLAQRTNDAPASREDVERYFQVAHSRELVQQVLDSMSNSMHEIVHEQYLKDRDKLPPDFEERMTRIVDDSWKHAPIDEMLQAMVPSYQKHFTKGDFDAMVAFTSSPTGQKVLRELPSVMGEAMEAMQPILQRQMEATRRRIEQEAEAAAGKSSKKAGQNSDAPAK